MDTLKVVIFFGIIFYVFYIIWIKGINDKDISDIKNRSLPFDQQMKESEKDILFRVVGFVVFLIFMIAFIYPNFIK